MKFAFAGIDFLGGVFEALAASGWQPIKLFSRPCDGIYDHNEAVVALARRHRVPIQLSRIRVADIEALSAEHGRDWALVVAGYPWLVTGWPGRVRYALNIHPSPLPDGRGPYPLFRAILDSYESWGVTAHVLAEEGFDTGDILAQDIFPLSAAETHESLLARCQMAAMRLARGPIEKSQVRVGAMDDDGKIAQQRVAVERDDHHVHGRTAAPGPAGWRLNRDVVGQRKGRKIARRRGIPSRMRGTTVSRAPTDSTTP